MSQPMLIAVGHKLPGWNRPMPEGAHLIIGPSGVIWRLYFNDLRREEVAAFANRMRVGIVRGGVHTLFILVQIDGVTTWSDASFSLGRLSPEEVASIPPREPNRGWAVTSILADGSNGIVGALRMGTVTPAFSQVLDDLLDEQRAALPGYSNEAQMQEIDAVYARWPSPDRMVEGSIITEDVGIKFHKLPKEPGGTA